MDSKSPTSFIKRDYRFAPCPSVCLSFCLSDCLSVCLSVYLSEYPSACQSVRLGTKFSCDNLKSTTNPFPKLGVHIKDSLRIMQSLASTNVTVTKIGNKDLLLIFSCAAFFCSYLHTIFLGQDLLIKDL